MHSYIEKIKKQLQIFTTNEEIVRITHEIDTIEKINIRTGSIDCVNKKYTKLNQLKTLRNKIIAEGNKYQNTQ